MDVERDISKAKAAGNTNDLIYQNITGLSVTGKENADGNVTKANAATQNGNDDDDDDVDDDEAADNSNSDDADEGQCHTRTHNTRFTVLVHVEKKKTGCEACTSQHSAYNNAAMCADT